MEVKLDNTAKEKLLIPIDKSKWWFSKMFKKVAR